MGFIKLGLLQIGFYQSEFTFMKFISFAIYLITPVNKGAYCKLILESWDIAY